ASPFTSSPRSRCAWPSGRCTSCPVEANEPPGKVEGLGELRGATDCPARTWGRRITRQQGSSTPTRGVSEGGCRSRLGLVRNFPAGGIMWQGGCRLPVGSRSLTTSATRDCLMPQRSIDRYNPYCPQIPRYRHGPLSQNEEGDGARRGTPGSGSGKW